MGRFGIEYNLSTLGNVTEVRLPAVNDFVTENGVVGTISSEREMPNGRMETLQFQIYSPVTGVITNINTELAQSPGSMATPSAAWGEEARIWLFEVGCEKIPPWSTARLPGKSWGAVAGTLFLRG